MAGAGSSRRRVDALLRTHGYGEGHGVVEALEGLCRCAADDLALRGAAATLMPNLGTNTVSASSAVARQLEEAQFGLGEGPSRDAFAARRPVLLADLVDVGTPRWPGWVPVALDAGVFAAYALPLHAGATIFGALTLYSGRRVLDGEGLETAFVYAEVATEILLDRGTGDGRRLAPDLDAALDTHAHVYQAQGMVMVDLGVTLAEALARMRAHAWSTDQDLTALAGDIVAGRVALPRDDG